MDFRGYPWIPIDTQGLDIRGYIHGPFGQIFRLRKDHDISVCWCFATLFRSFSFVNGHLYSILGIEFTKLSSHD